MKKLGNPELHSVVVIGDTPFDALAAGKLGLPSVGVRCGGFPEDDLRTAGCRAIYQDPADLLAHFDTSPETWPFSPDCVSAKDEEPR